MGVSFNLSAEIATIEDVSAWGVIIKDKNGDVIDTYYAANEASSMDLNKNITLKKSIFNSDNVADISICPFYIYGWYATLVNLESTQEQIKWELKLETRGHSHVSETSEEVSLYTEGFDMSGAANDCTIGFLYGKSSNLYPGNCDMAISNQKYGGDVSVTLYELDSNTTYYYKAFVQIEGNYFLGETMSFKTKGNTSCPDSNHPHMIDLGLPSGTQWRCCNVGASTPEAYGGYYAFGQLSSAPTLDQIKELVNYCSYQWTTQNGVKGGKFTGPNGGTIFLPAAGYRWRGELDWVGTSGLYWSSTPYDEHDACILYFASHDAFWYDWNYDRGYESSVRPVR